MIRGIHIALLTTSMVGGATCTLAQNQKPQQPDPQQQQSPKPAEANPFPEDTTTVPVVPTTEQPTGTVREPSAPSRGETTNLLKEDTDPIRSPDDVANPSGSDGFSSSLAGANDFNIPAEEEKRKKHDKLAPPPHQEDAKEDENVGAYYLGQKNWKAALSRFQSALVTDPENPDVYWGLAEAQRQLGDFANAKANYSKVVEFDPDSKHSKEAQRFLKQPEISKAPAVSSNAPAQNPQQ